MADRIQLRRDLAANWTASNPVLAQGEVGIELDNFRFKIGDGVSVWSSLPYYHTDSIYVHEQATAAQTWVIVHNMDKNPSVTVVDTAGGVQIPDQITYDNTNQITISFLGSFAGKAFLN